DHARDRNERQDVREGLEQDGRRVGVGGEPERERGGRAEEERSSERAERAPVAEDERGERDEATTRGHVLVERADEADRQIRTAESRQDPGHGDTGIAREI